MGGAGYRQRQSAIPDPLALGSLRERLGTLGLPGAMLSWASLLAFLITLAAVQHSAALRAHYAFFLPLPWLAALGASALAGAVVIAGSRRPGRLWPRVWALTNAGLASAIALVALVRPGWLPAPQLHALVTATLAANLALAPRLAWLHPDSEWTQRIAPLGFLVSLGLILPPALLGAQGRAVHPDHPAQAGATGAAQTATRGDTAVTTDLTPRALLDKTLFTWKGTPVRANELARLWEIDLATARRLQPGGRNDCGGRAFEQPDREYRIDCLTSAPAVGGRGADLVAELRIVYSARTGGLSERAAPSEIWYAFALAPGVSRAERDAYQRRTLRAFLDALKDAGLAVTPTRGDSGADQGYRIKGQRQSWKMPPPVIDHHLADRDWVVIRVLPD